MIAALFTYVLAIFALFVVAAFLFQKRRPKGFPPGPASLPIVGNLHQLGLEPYKKFMKMSEEYGGVFAIDFGSFRGVVINDYKLIKQAFADPTFSGRPALRPFIERSGGGHTRGLIMSDGQRWQEQRRFVLRNLRDFGFGTRSMQSLVQDDIQEFIENLRKEVGKPISMQNRFNCAVLNSLWVIVTGERFNHHDKDLQTVTNVLSASLQESNAAGAFFFFPLLSKIAPELTGYNRFMSSVDPITDLLKRYVEEHKESYQPETTRDLIDVYWQEILKTSEKHSSFFGDEGEKNLLISLMDLFAAGAETTSSTLVWAFLFMALNQDKQEKLYEEIINVIGESSLPSLSDKPNMPYTEALIMEVMRFSAMVPLSVFHSTTEDTVLDGHFIPKDTLVVPNLYAALKDPKVWGDPDTFRPERFIKPDGTVDRHHEAFIPFSTGKRACLGESLARDELFLFITSLFQQFKVVPDPTQPLSPHDHHMGPVLIPKYHELIVLERT